MYVYMYFNLCNALTALSICLSIHCLSIYLSLIVSRWSCQVITPEEIVDPNVDEHSVMTYLSQFPKAKLKPGAPLRPKLNPKKARAYGPGRQPPVLAGWKLLIGPPATTLTCRFPSTHLHQVWSQ